MKLVIDSNRVMAGLIKDSPFLAVGIYSGSQGIWTEDKDFDEQSILKRYSTKDLFDMLLKS